MFILGFISGCGHSTENGTYQDIEATEAFELIKNKQVLILDVRTPGEYAQGHIKNSVLAENYTKILDHRETPVFLYCRSGNRSVTASKILMAHGFKKVYNLKNGINGWLKEGYPVEKNPL